MSVCTFGSMFDLIFQDKIEKIAILLHWNWYKKQEHEIHDWWRP